MANCGDFSEIRVWTLGGDLVYTLSGHTSFVYSLSVLSSGDIISAGEDRTVRVWKGADRHQERKFKRNSHVPELCPLYRGEALQLPLLAWMPAYVPTNDAGDVLDA